MNEPFDYTQCTDPDGFFYYGQNSLQYECSSDLVQLLEQPIRSTYYGRSMGVGIRGYENFPNTFALQVMLRYAIVNIISKRNMRVTTGVYEGENDRRIAVSQASISFDQDNAGNMDITILYILYADYSKQITVKIPMGASR